MKLDRLKEGKTYRVENNKIVDEEGVVFVDLEDCSSYELKFIDVGVGKRRLVLGFSIVCSSFLAVNGFFLVLDSRLLWALISGFFSAVVMGIGIGWGRNFGVYGILFVKGKKFWLENEEERKKIRDVILYIEEKERRKKEKDKRKKDKRKEEKEDEGKRKWGFW